MDRRRGSTNRNNTPQRSGGMAFRTPSEGGTTGSNSDLYLNPASSSTNTQGSNTRHDLHTPSRTNGGRNFWQPRTPSSDQFSANSSSTHPHKFQHRHKPPHASSPNSSNIIKSNSPEAPKRHFPNHQPRHNFQFRTPNPHPNNNINNNNNNNTNKTTMPFRFRKGLNGGPAMMKSSMNSNGSRPKNNSSFSSRIFNKPNTTRNIFRHQNPKQAPADPPQLLPIYDDSVPDDEYLVNDNKNVQKQDAPQTGDFISANDTNSGITAVDEQVQKQADDVDQSQQKAQDSQDQGDSLNKTAESTLSSVNNEDSSLYKAPVASATPVTKIQNNNIESQDKEQSEEAISELPSDKISKKTTEKHLDNHKTVDSEAIDNSHCSETSHLENDSNASSKNASVDRPSASKPHKINTISKGAFRENSLKLSPTTETALNLSLTLENGQSLTTDKHSPHISNQVDIESDESEKRIVSTSETDEVMKDSHSNEPMDEDDMDQDIEDLFMEDANQAVPESDDHSLHTTTKELSINSPAKKIQSPEASSEGFKDHKVSKEFINLPNSSPSSSVDFGSPLEPPALEPDEPLDTMSLTDDNLGFAHLDPPRTPSPEPESAMEAEIYLSSPITKMPRKRSKRSKKSESEEIFYQVFNDLESKTEEAEQSFETLEECTYTSRSMGCSGQYEAMTCDCREHWGRFFLMFYFHYYFFF